MRIPDRFAANVAWLFVEYPWLDRFPAAAAAGFGAVEFPWPDDPSATARAVRAAGVRVALLNAPAGDLAAGERGWPNDPARVAEWRDGFGRALELAAEIACPTINVLAGNRVADTSDADQLACLAENLAWALDAAAPSGVIVVTELLNPSENPRYLLTTLDAAAPLLDRLAPLGWRLQLDTYHLGLTVADVPGAIRRAGDALGHLQVADVPGRHQPGTGELDWEAIGRALADVGYAGPIGLEYVASGDAVESVMASPIAGWSP